VAALSTLAACPDIEPSLKPLQLGVGVRGGSEAIGHVLRSALNANAESVVVHMEFTNAFNSISRVAVIVAMAQHHPQLLPLVSWLYGQQSNL
jgi:5,10-methylene-tetrahydrofolate dehydrogenase/methenyl tetrahydrofolate cyclohydrolase